jgi:multimeric flavodoxin WrbA
MKILTIQGSPHKGNTFHVTEKVEQYLKQKEDIEFEHIFLKDMHLELCKGCFSCLRIGEEHCPLKDDRDMLYKKMMQADAVIFASPVYVMNVTALMKNFVDRFAYICHRPRFFTKHAMVITTTGVIGLKEVKEYLEIVASVWGFRTVTKLGVATPPHKNIPSTVIQKRNQVITKAAEQFYQTLKKKEWKPSLNHIIQFRVQRGVFLIDKTAKEMPKDHEFYKPLKNKKFYVKAKVGFFKNLIAWALEKIIVRTSMKGMK